MYIVSTHSRWGLAGIEISKYQSCRYFGFTWELHVKALFLGVITPGCILQSSDGKDDDQLACPSSLGVIKIAQLNRDLDACNVFLD